ncbi:hypothetical protein [Devosia sp. MC521]|uniref:hypothetical protein n=1 Tax=Devosia sp. MC521 TaxID=2759954 RepID=UPI0015F7F976|nr:hypothetical protein [Devosia sp. MC521]MBJ6986950.1 hypothetical protein [Devosia sp. MC521]QMW63974.1 hypothetical protein H4N61_06560 [Devosia sp. MC521]
MSRWRDDSGRKSRDPRRRRDPLSIGVAFLVNIGWGGAITGLGATLVGSAIIGAGVLGASALLNAFTPKPQFNTPTPQDRQATVRQSTGARVRFYGTNKVGGTLSFFESKGGFLYSQTTLNEGEISQIKEVWLNDQLVAIGGDGYVTTDPYEVNFGFGGLKKVARILFRMGQSAQTAYSELISAFPGVYTSAHRMRGVANALTIFEEVEGEQIGKVYPQGPPTLRVVADFSLVKSVRTGVRIFSDNPADCVYDYLTGRDGAGFPYGAGFPESKIDLASFQAFANLCDQPVPLKSGGTEKRYRLALGYSLTEEMRSVLGRMCQACDADLYINSAGKIAIRGGKFTAPTLMLDDSKGHIISADFQRGQGALVAFNELTIKYTDAAQGFVETEAQRWVDAVNVALRGRVLPHSLDLLCVPSHSQARRVAKIYTHKSNPVWTGTIVTNFYGLNAIGEETLTIKFGPMGIDTTFAITGLQILDDLTGVQLQLSSLSPTAYAWDAALEEGTPSGVAPGTGGGTSLPLPTSITAATEQVAIDGSLVGVRLIVGWTRPPREALGVHAQYKKSTESVWQDMQTADDRSFATSALVDDGGTYNYRVRTLSPAGSPGSWSSVGSITVTADPVAPGVVTAVSATGGTAQITFGWSAPNSANYAGSRLYINTSNSMTGATLVATEFGPPNIADTRVVTGVSAGTRYGFVVAINRSGIPTTAVATGAITVS